MSSRSEKELASRVSFLLCAKKIRPARGIGRRTADLPIWQYWHEGQASAPPVIKRCLGSVSRWSGDRRVTILDQENLSRHVELPRQVLANVERMGQTHFSDIVRTHLLTQHGGTWLDASVYLTGPLQAVVDDLPFFVFSRPNDPFVLSSWLMHAWNGHPLPTALAQMLATYWAENDRLRDYFTIHFMFEAAISLHPQLKTLWLGMPRRMADAPHRLQFSLDEELSDAVLGEIVAGSHVHKLTYKLSTDRSQKLLRLIERADHMTSVERIPTMR